MEFSNKFSVAPMMTHTDRHFRYFLRLLSRHSMLYTEMLTTGALLYGDTDRYARFNDAEHPVGMQLGGSNPADLASCAEIATAFGYDEINLNVGLSQRTGQGRTLSALASWLNPDWSPTVSAAMAEATDLPGHREKRVPASIGQDEL